MPCCFPITLIPFLAHTLSSHTLQINHRAQHAASGLQSIAAVESAAAHPCRAGTFAKHLLWQRLCPACRQNVSSLPPSEEWVPLYKRGHWGSERWGTWLQSHCLSRDKLRHESSAQTLPEFIPGPLFDLGKPGGRHSVGLRAVCTCTCYLRSLFLTATFTNWLSEFKGILQRKPKKSKKQCKITIIIQVNPNSQKKKTNPKKHKNSKSSYMEKSLLLSFTRSKKLCFI